MELAHFSRLVLFCIYFSTRRSLSTCVRECESIDAPYSNQTFSVHSKSPRSSHQLASPANERAIFNSSSVKLLSTNQRNGSVSAIEGSRDSVSAKHTSFNGTRFKKSIRYYCHVDEGLLNTTGSRVKRYVLQGGKWKKLELTWAVITQSRHSEVNSFLVQEFTKALEVWSKVSKLTFTRVSEHSKNVDISVGFHEYDHGDNYAFDGRGKTLAHAFYPGTGAISGDVHFDDTENFKRHSEINEDSDGTSLFITAAHELGHSLGLKHSNADGSLMAPYYKPFEYDFDLPHDDKMAIQSLYGRPEDLPRLRPQIKESTPQPTTRSTTRRTTTRSTTRRTTHTTHRTSYHPHRPTDSPYIPTRPPYRPTETPYRPTQPPYRPTEPPHRPTDWPPKTTPSTTRTTMKPDETLPPTACNLQPPIKPGMPDMCSSSFDAATNYGPEVFFFKNEYLWRVDFDHHERGFHQYRIDQMFPELRRFGITKIDAAFSLQDDKGLVLFAGQSMVTIGMVELETRKRNITEIGLNTTHIDAAWRWGHNGHVYLISGDQYWRLGHDNNVQADYPRDSAVWQGLPSNISAALTYRGLTYFFAGNVFWTFENIKMRAKLPALEAASYWFGCPHFDSKEKKVCSLASSRNILHQLLFISIMLFHEFLLKMLLGKVIL